MVGSMARIDWNEDTIIYPMYVARQSRLSALIILRL